MNFKDQGIILAKKKIKENLLILIVLTRLHGIYSGIVKNIGKKNINFTHQICNLVDLHWKGRLDEHLGVIKCEVIKSYLYPITSNKFNLLSIQSLIDLTLKYFSEREVNTPLFNKWELYLQSTSSTNNSVRDYIDFELFILQSAGYGLDLKYCVITHSTSNLSYVSPKSGKAVSYEVGKPYANKLLILPQFLLIDKVEPQTIVEIELAFNLTSYFLNKHLMGNKKLSIFRELLLQHIADININAS